VRSGYPDSTSEGNGADELGGAVLVPQNVPLNSGLAFTARRADGKIITGMIRNRLGHGFSVVDGYGLINAQAAVLGH
jgi:hypothetical protein